MKDIEFLKQLKEMDFPYQITWTNNKNAYIKISDQGEVLFYIPQRLKNDQELWEILQKKARKLRQKHQSRPKIEKRNEKGVLLFGEFIEREEISPNRKPKTDKNIEKMLKEILLEYTREYVKIFTQKLGIDAKSITIKKSKTKRGSCSYDQNLMFNLSLIFLPSEKIQYVVAHEVAHLQEKNHQLSFRKLVEKLFPKYKKVRKELKNLIII